MAHREDLHVSFLKTVRHVIRGHKFSNNANFKSLTSRGLIENYQKCFCRQGSDRKNIYSYFKKAMRDSARQNYSCIGNADQVANCASFSNLIAYFANYLRSVLNVDPKVQTVNTAVLLSRLQHSKLLYMYCHVVLCRLRGMFPVFTNHIKYVCACNHLE